MMKIFCILLFVFFLHVEAQRRTQTRQEVSNADHPARGRGRSRFTATETEYSRSPETISRRIPSRRRQEVGPSTPAQKLNYPPPAPSTPSYAVEEVIDEGDAKPKLKALPEPKIDSQEILSKSYESDSQAAEKRSSVETSGERFSEELGIPTVKVDTDRSSISRENSEDIQPKLNEKVVPITRNNVRSGSKAAERKTDVRNGGSRTSDRGSRNGNSRSTNDNTISTSRNGSTRSRGENNISSRRQSVVEDSGYNSRQDTPNEIPSPRAESSILSNKLSDPTDESEIRKEIVRNSMPKLPSPIGISAILSDPPLPKKTVKKTIKTRLNTNARNEEATVSPRGKSNPRVVENFATAPRVASRTVEDYNPSARGQSASEDTQSVRSRSNTTPRNEAPGRSRTRATRKPAEVVQTVTIPSRRSGRRRTESATTSAPLPRRGPSVFSATEDFPSTRSRTGRRIEVEVPKTQIDQSQHTRSSGRGRSKGTTVSSDQLSSSSSRRQTFRSRNEDQATKPSRQRFNPRSPLYIDETKLEVLPLFEGETKIISESGRKPNQLDELINSVTEGVINPPENATPLISISSDVSVSSKVSSMKISSRRKSQRKPEIKESVVSQVTEVTSKRTITRKPISRPGSKRLTNKKTLEKKLNGLTSSEEDISDSDNYPAPFKALIQSKKQVKESRPSNVPEEDTKTKKIEELVSSSESPRPVLASPNVPSRTTTYPIKYGEDSENEVQLKPSTTTTTSRPTKKRLSPSFKNLELKNRKSTTAAVKTVTRTTSAPTKEIKFHSKFNSVSKNKPIPTSKPFNSVASKGLSFNRKNKESEKYSVNKTKNGADAGSNRGQPTSAPLHKSSRYSSRYRSSGSSRSAPRTSTAPPAYIPTIPSVRSYNPTENAGL